MLKLPSISCHTCMKTAILAMMAVCCLATCISVWAQTPAHDARAILRQAALYQNQFRTGQLDIFPAYVEMLDTATEVEPNNAELWYAMAVASFAQAAATVLNGGTMADVGPAFQQGQAALTRALELNPAHPEALSLRGGTRLMLAALARKPEVAVSLTDKAIADLNHAVKLAPASERTRLQRAFSGLTLPASLRNHATEAEDLDFLVKVAGKSRAGDYMKIMRGDLHSELGQFDQARTLYQQVETSTSPAATTARVRLSALERGVVPESDIQALRSAAGAQCVMCHGN